MKKSKFTEQQIDRVCASASGGGAQVCRKMGISEATFHPWKQLYGGLIVSAVLTPPFMTPDDGRVC